MSAAKGEGPGSHLPAKELLAGLPVFRHTDFLDRLKDLPDGSDERIMGVIRNHIAVFRRNARKNGLTVGVLNEKYSPGYKAPAAEILFMIFFKKFVLLDIRLGGFSEEELMQYDSHLKK